MIDRPNLLVLITGSSSGIGRAMARHFASHGHDIILTSEDSTGLKDAMAEIRSVAPNASVDVIAVDLTQPEGAEQLYRAVQALGRPVDVLVNNAGVGVWGEFWSTGLDREIAMIRLNIEAVVRLTKRFVKEMVARGQGRILFTSSEAAMTPTALAAVYAGTKAFDLVFAEALREEVKDKGITVTALMPGPTDTNWFRRAGAQDTRMAHKHLADPNDVAKAAYDALMSGDDHVVTPMTDRMMVTAANVMPLKARVQRME